jgi:cyanophycinase
MSIAPDPARGRRFDATAGPLVLIGGACSAAGDALGAFLDLAGARDHGRIVGFTTASSDPTGSAHAWKNDFAAAGARNVVIPIVDRRDRAQDERVAEMVREARGIFLGGGDQIHLVATLDGSRVAGAIRDAHRHGAVVCGTSAGAAALTETILANGEPDESGTITEMYMGRGLGLLGFNAVIDTHFGARRRMHRLFNAIAANPGLLGLGIDEDTALVVRGPLGHVVGQGGVTFVDGRDVHFTNASESHREGALTISYLRVGVVGHGHTLNLRHRELDVVLPDRDAGATPTVLGDEAGGE